MPRNGSGVYSRPFPDVEEDTTIESAVYNGFTADIAIDMNDPRPIVAGGTGAATAITALNNLGGETAKQLVTNYTSHVWQPGSFYSAGVGGDGAPVNGHKFIGLVYMADDQNIVLEARDESDTIVPGRVYIKEKKAGSWSAWKLDGRTMTGDADGISSETSDMFYGLRGTAPASKFVVNTESDPTTGIDAFQVNKAGAVTMTGALNVGGIITGATDMAAKDITAFRSANEGVVYLGSNQLHYLYWSGTAYTMPTGPLTVGGTVTASEPTATNHLATKNYVDKGVRNVIVHTPVHRYLTAADAGSVIGIANAGASYFIVQRQVNAPMVYGMQFDLINWGCPDCQIWPADGLVLIYSEDQRRRLRTNWATATLLYVGGESWMLTGSLI